MQKRKELSFSQEQEPQLSEDEKIQQLIDRADQAVVENGIQRIQHAEDTSDLVIENQNDALVDQAAILEPAKEKLSVEPIIKHKTFVESLPEGAVTTIEAKVVHKGEFKETPSIVTYVDEEKNEATIQLGRKSPSKIISSSVETKKPQRENKFTQPYTLKTTPEKKRSYNLF